MRSPISLVFPEKPGRSRARGDPLLLWKDFCSRDHFSKNAVVLIPYPGDPLPQGGSLTGIGPRSSNQSAGTYARQLTVFADDLTRDKGLSVALGLLDQALSTGRKVKNHRRRLKRKRIEIELAPCVALGLDLFAFWRRRNLKNKSFAYRNELFS